MNKTFSKFRQELGKACTVSAAGILVAIFVTSKLTGKQLEVEEIIFCLIFGLLMLTAGALLLAEDKVKPLPGKWKRVKVKKDTTIHIEEENL